VASRNATLALPEELLRRLKILAAWQDTSISALLTATLSELVDQEEGYCK
jgi:predicted transcriptional regulator